MLRAFQRNSLEAISARAYDELIIRRRIFGRRSVQYSDPAAVRRIVVENAPHYVKPVQFRRVTRPFTGDGVLLTEGETWRRQRRRLAGAFTPSSLDALFPAFESAAATLAERLSGVSEADLATELEAAALDAVTLALVSGVEPARRERLNATVRTYVSGEDAAARPSIFDVLARRIDDFDWAQRDRAGFSQRWFAEVDALIDARRRNPREPASDLLDLLLAARDAETGRPLAADEVRSQLATLLLAGFETTARLLFWTVYLLVLAPDEQARIRAEVQATDARAVGELDRWPRLRCVLQEAARLYPPVPILFREALAADLVEGDQVRARDMIGISPWIMHRHRKLWDDPEAFEPDRFEGRPTAHLLGGAYIPFSAGPRICIGANFAMAEASVVLAGFLRRFELALDDSEPVMPTALFSLQPSRRPRFRLTPLSRPLRTAA
jgi:cytochrome P450